MTTTRSATIAVLTYRRPDTHARLVDRLDELEDVQNVYHTMNITDEIAEALAEDE